MDTPKARFPEMTFPSPAFGPPTKLLNALLRSTPSSPLPIFAAPSAEGADAVAEDVRAADRVAAEGNAVLAIPGNKIALAGRCAADPRVGHLGERADPVHTVGQRLLAAELHADQIALHHRVGVR